LKTPFRTLLAFLVGTTFVAPVVHARDAAAPQR